MERHSINQQHLPRGLVTSYLINAGAEQLACGLRESICIDGREASPGGLYVKGRLHCVEGGKGVHVIPDPPSRPPDHKTIAR